MKKKIKLFITFILFFTLSVNSVYALSVSDNNITIEENTSKSIDLYADINDNVTTIKFSLVYSTYDIPAIFYVDSAFTDNNPDGPIHTLTLNDNKSGKVKLGTVTIRAIKNPTDKAGTVTVSNASTVTSDDIVTKLDMQTINVSIGSSNEPIKEEIKEPVSEEVDKNLLKEITSEIVDIKLIKDKFEYTVSIDKELTELDIKAIPNDTKYQVDISSQKIAELKNNKILITVKSDKIEQIYTINVKEKIDYDDIRIDRSTFNSNNDYKSTWIVVTIGCFLILLVGVILLNKKK